MTLGEYIAEKVREALTESIKDSKDELTGIAVEGGKAAHGNLLGDVGSIVDIVSKVLGDIPIIGGLIGDVIDPLKPIEDEAGKFGLGIGMGYLLGSFAYQMMQPALRTPIQQAERLFHSMQLDPATAARMQAKAIKGQQDWPDEANLSGVDGERFANLVSDTRVYPSFAELLELMNRGEVNQAQIELVLQRSMLDPEFYAAIIELRNAVLSPADVALAALRGNMTEDDGAAIAAKSGVSRDDFTVLMGNTGEPPGLMQLLEAYRRGIIDKDRLERGIRQSRYRDEWIPMLEALRFGPMTVADAARAVVEDYMTPEEGAKIAEENGLRAEDWPIILESWGRPLSHEQMMSLYFRGQATLDDVRQAMRESDVKNKYIDKAIELGRRLVPERTIVSMIDHATITHDEGVAMLKEWGYTEDDAIRLVNLGTAQHAGSHHTLSKTDTLAMYTDGLINRAAAVKYLTDLGYPTAVADQMLSLADYKRKASLARIQLRGIEAELKAGDITPGQAREKLVAAGLDSDQAKAYVDEWTQAKKVATRSLTEAQVIKAISDGIITVDDGRVRLRAMGLSDKDVDVLYKIHGFIAYTPIPLPTIPPGQQ